MALAMQDDETVFVQVNPHRYYAYREVVFSPRAFIEIGPKGERTVKWDYSAAQFWTTPDVAQKLVEQTPDMLKHGIAAVATILKTRNAGESPDGAGKPARRAGA